MSVNRIGAMWCALLGAVVVEWMLPAPGAPVGTNELVLEPGVINQFVEQMRSNNPALLAADARVRAARANADGVRIWEDPMLRVGGQAADTSMRSSEGDLIYGMEQRLPLFGKTQAARRVARTEADVEQAGADYLFQSQRRTLALLLFKAALAGRTVEIGGQDRLWIEALLSATDAKYRSGQASLTELVLLQNELSRRTNQLRTDEQWLAQSQVEINRMLNRAEKSPLPPLRLPGVADSIVYSEKLVALSLRYEPKSRVMREQIRQADAMVEVSRTTRYPEVGLDLEGRNYTGNGDFRQGMFLARFSVPLGNAGKYRKDIERDRERAKAAKLDLADQELAVRQEIHQSVVAIDAARREALLYRDEIIPRTEQAMAAARSQWEGGRGSFRDILDARRMLLEARLMEARAIAEQWQALSDLVLCCGLGDLEALLMLKEPK